MHPRLGSVSALVAESLEMLCRFNGPAVGAVFQVTAEGRLALAASSAGVSEAFLEGARLLWRAGGGRASAAGEMHLFPIDRGAVVLSRVRPDQCSPATREAILTVIARELQGTPASVRVPGEVLASMPVRDISRERLRSVLEQNEWVIERAARREGVTSRTIRNRMRALGIERPPRR